ncbi:DNA replication/repair protein RecF [Halorhodospira halophila]|uniref:DNA replication and repair protein RecF n=1 Tax=Halorhodospira halophila (strain DSM 244 / SL1) TaxID=349124 RepID=A1WWD8_HALHL|nr:DNA replication/repair protein RecF [Halorhodospira halophila]ABM62000.1 DNA replication and repair protein RecF [Halorhodospira halophila SL1]MBK1729390.1 DNA replication/repair protein RecF [Halorhodospira halophila]
MERLEVHGFRNLADTQLRPHPHLNVVTGPNGAGKTSLLEAIYFLSRVRSFRTRQNDRLIGWGAEEARVVAVRGHDRLGAARTPGHTRLRLNGADAHTRSALAARLPVQLMNTEHQRLLLDGPRVRRQFLDWGTFHLEPDYRELAQRYQHALRQRNAALRVGDRRSEQAWTPVLIRCAAAVDVARQRFIEALRPIWSEFARQWLGLESLELRYYRGAAAELPWERVLDEQLERDRTAGFTHRGPHRADLILSRDRIPAADALSRGQQKLLVVALLIAEVKLWSRQGLTPVLLIDDLPAELDPAHLHTVLDTVTGDPTQVFLTAIDGAALPTDLPPGQWYQVCEGRVSAMV